VFLAGARDGDYVVWLLIDAIAARGMIVEPLRLAALQASSTVVATFDEFVLPADRLLHREPFADWSERDGQDLRVNGSLALGVTRRACALLGASAFDEQLRIARRQLDDAAPSQLPTARAAAADLALRSTAALVALGAGRAITLEHHAQRLAREALFLLVQGQTTAIRSEQIRMLGR
jgi:alkylation response protein AidB-like acyl-CoA dehydrogenase